jgi:hypothetical protein
MWQYQKGLFVNLFSFGLTSSADAELFLFLITSINSSQKSCYKFNFIYFNTSNVIYHQSMFLKHGKHGLELDKSSYLKMRYWIIFVHCIIQCRIPHKFKLFRNNQYFTVIFGNATGYSNPVAPKWDFQLIPRIAHRWLYPYPWSIYCEGYNSSQPKRPALIRELILSTAVAAKHGMQVRPFMRNFKLSSRWK